MYDRAHRLQTRMTNLTSRVESRRSSYRLKFVFTVSHPFVCECHNITTIPILPTPPRQTVHAVFPHTAYRQSSSQAFTVHQPNAYFEGSISLYLPTKTANAP